jgi:hypothetical protein
MGAAHGKSAHHAGGGSAANMSPDVEVLVRKLTEVRKRSGVSSSLFFYSL